VARGLAQKKTYNLGLLLPMEYAVTDFHFFKDCMNGICEAAAEYDYDIIVCMSDGENLRQVQRLVQYRKVDGIILSRAVEESNTQKYLKEKGMPYLVIGPNTDPDTVSLDNRNEEASGEITERMLQKGIKRLALFGGQEAHSVTQSRYRGFVQAHEKNSVKIIPELLLDNHGKTMQAVEKILETDADGIICMDDYICMLTLGCLREKGISVPQKLKIASLYDSAQLEHNYPSVSSVRFDAKNLGMNACRKLLALLGEEAEEENGTDYQVILRESTE
jgi:DNA-binding LacI/PurR family transcriptional regulator